MTISLREIDNFGNLAAEEDAVLDYFLATDSVSQVERSEKFLVLGRKGAGKTAIVRYFTEGETGILSKALNLRAYPWNVHALRVDRGASEIEAYVASWRYLLAVEVASFTVQHSGHQYHDEKKCLEDFLNENYGGTRPRLSEILQPKKLKIGRFTFQPSIFGNQIGSINLERGRKDLDFGLELNALTQSILKSTIRLFKDSHIGSIYIHFDDLDHGLQRIDDQRSAMIIGLIIAARDMRREFIGESVGIHPVIYLRTDIWDDLVFSDKNKIAQGLALLLEWDRDSLLDLVRERIRVKLGDHADWNDIIDDKQMRGSQPKWNHIVARTLRRPRDVIQFLNVALKIAKKRSDNPLVFINTDIVESRNDYSSYLKRELDDEILPHWPKWEEALQACSAIATEIFLREAFIREYSKKKSKGNPIEADEALRILHRFSVIGYEKRSGYGGSSWTFLFEEPDAGWDSSANRFKVHPGLKEYAKLRESRT